jgi:hypothetical protein
MSDRYETLYPYLEAATNEGGMKLLTKEELGDKPVYDIIVCILSYLPWNGIYTICSIVHILFSARCTSSLNNFIRRYTIHS